MAFGEGFRELYDKIVAKLVVIRCSLYIPLVLARRTPLLMRLPFEILTLYSILSAQSLSVFESAYYRMSDTIGMEGASNSLFS
jgi:hypothetical protein